MGIFGNAFGWPHLIVILAVILLLFGATKLPALAKSVGQSARVFKGEMKAMKQDDAESVAEVVAEAEADAKSRKTGSTSDDSAASKSSDASA